MNVDMNLTWIYYQGFLYFIESQENRRTRQQCMTCPQLLLSWGFRSQEPEVRSLPPRSVSGSPGLPLPLPGAAPAAPPPVPELFPASSSLTPASVSLPKGCRDDLMSLLHIPGSSLFFQVHGCQLKTARGTLLAGSTTSARFPSLVGPPRGSAFGFGFVPSYL